jgi:hypothetical protein
MSEPGRVEKSRKQCRAAQERVTTREQSDAIARFHQERAVKFDEIVSALAIDLRYGDPAMLSQDDKDILLDEAEQTIELWEEDAEMGNEPKVVTSLQNLLSQYHELGERILHIHDQDLDIVMPGSEAK